VRPRKEESDDVVAHLPDALSPQTLHATKVFVPVEELDELESAADDVAVTLDEVGENGWLSARQKWEKF
jgi:hypothetical protein